VVIGPDEEPLAEVRVRASAGQAAKLIEWAVVWPERTWAVEGAAGLAHLLARQLVAAREHVLDVQPQMGRDRSAHSRRENAGDERKPDRPV
jgi:transposase